MRNQMTGSSGVNDENQHEPVGCVWLKTDWSCAYDRAFVAYASHDWRQAFGEVSPTARHLAKLYDTLLSRSQHNDGNFVNQRRGSFRDVLMERDCVTFPGHGRKIIATTVTHVLNYAITTGWAWFMTHESVNPVKTKRLPLLCPAAKCANVRPVKATA